MSALQHIVVMGVSGAGKSTTGEALARHLGWPFTEGDAFHPEANVAKMSAGTPLTDADRWPWLDRIVTWTSVESAAGRETLVTCSALRRVYRDRLRETPGRTIFVHLTGTPELLEQRMGARVGHFMPPALLTSQLATLEPLQDDEDGIVVSIAPSTAEIVAEIIARLSLVPASA